jgi:hypothetical protein
VPVVALDRRFIEWKDQDPPDAEIRIAFGLSDGRVGWDELLVNRRVIILAEAGSGKSTEMGERARMTAATGRYAFHATVEDVGCDSLEGAISVAGRAGLAAWRTSTEEGGSSSILLMKRSRAVFGLRRFCEGWLAESLALKNERTSFCQAESAIGSFAKTWIRSEDTTTGNYLSFVEVLARLSARAAGIAGASHDSPQPEVAVLDVSNCEAALITQLLLVSGSHPLIGHSLSGRAITLAR